MGGRVEGSEDLRNGRGNAAELPVRRIIAKEGNDPFELAERDGVPLHERWLLAWRHTKREHLRTAEGMSEEAENRTGDGRGVLQPQRAGRGRGTGLRGPQAAGAASAPHPSLPPGRLPPVKGSEATPHSVSSP